MHTQTKTPALDLQRLVGCRLLTMPWEVEMGPAGLAAGREAWREVRVPGVDGGARGAGGGARGAVMVEGCSGRSGPSRGSSGSWVRGEGEDWGVGGLVEGSAICRTAGAAVVALPPCHPAGAAPGGPRGRGGGELGVLGSWVRWETVEGREGVERGLGEREKAVSLCSSTGSRTENRWTPMIMETGSFGTYLWPLSATCRGRKPTVHVRTTPCASGEVERTLQSRKADLPRLFL